VRISRAGDMGNLWVYKKKGGGSRLDFHPAPVDSESGFRSDEVPTHHVHWMEWVEDRELINKKAGETWGRCSFSLTRRLTRMLKEADGRGSIPCLYHHDSLDHAAGNFQQRREIILEGKKPSFRRDVTSI